MKRVILLVLFVALAAGAAWWVEGRHDGDLKAAFADAKAVVTGNAPRTQAAAEGTPEGGRRPGGSPGGEGPRVAVVSSVARTADLPIIRTGVGWIEPIATVTLRARVDGQILEQRVQDGQMVKRGDVLFRLDDRETQAQIARDEAALARDEASLTKAQADLRRTQELLSRNSASQVQVEQYEADAKVAAANVAADRAALEADQIRLGYATVTAPISGRLGIIRVTEGNLVRGNDITGDGLVTITQMNPLRVSFSLPERDLDLVRAALNRKDPAAVRVLAGDGSQTLATGTLAFIDSSVDQASGTITVKAMLPNEDARLWPGQYVRVEVDVGKQANATTVPLVAIQPGQDSSFAFVVTPDKVVERRKVDIAMSAGDVAAVASGIRPGEHVVVEGQLRLRNGSRVNETLASTSVDNRTAAAEAQKKIR